MMTLEEAMSTEPVRQTLQMGLHEGRIRAATKLQLEHRGRPFDTADDLVRAVLGGQVYNEVDLDDLEASNNSNVITRLGHYWLSVKRSRGEDRVRCAWCQGVVGQWEEGDDPFVVHQRFFPACPRAVLGPNIDIPAGERISELGIQTTRPPRMPKYSSLDARLRTFAQWPVPEIQRGDVLAQAGFYYQGNQDQVRCFQCDGGLKCWLADDDPWCEHARWFPKCQFVQLMKGQAYIESVQRKIEEKPALASDVGDTKDTGHLLKLLRRTSSFFQSSTTVLDVELALGIFPDSLGLITNVQSGSRRLCRTITWSPYSQAVGQTSRAFPVAKKPALAILSGLTGASLGHLMKVLRRFSSTFMSLIAEDWMRWRFFVFYFNGSLGASRRWWRWRVHVGHIGDLIGEGIDIDRTSPIVYRRRWILIPVQIGMLRRLRSSIG
uniref:Uncharacterized protein n=1 Tax=Phlebotomus papatasi TaxID=29031 RepID=A0A1B0DCW6_PHLPP